MTRAISTATRPPFGSVAWHSHSPRSSVTGSVKQSVVPPAPRSELASEAAEIIAGIYLCNTCFGLNPLKSVRRIPLTQIKTTNGSPSKTAGCDPDSQGKLQPGSVLLSLRWVHPPAQLRPELLHTRVYGARLSPHLPCRGSAFALLAISALPAAAWGRMGLPPRAAAAPQSGSAARGGAQSRLHPGSIGHRTRASSAPDGAAGREGKGRDGR